MQVKQAESHGTQARETGSAKYPSGHDESQAAVSGLKKKPERQRAQSDTDPLEQVSQFKAQTNLVLIGLTSAVGPF